MDGVVAVGAAGVLAEAGVKSGLDGVAAVAQVGDILESQHVAVGRAVGIVAGLAAFKRTGAVLKDERSLFVGVAFVAGLVLEAAQALAAGGLVWIVAAGAGHDTLFQPVMLVELELGGHVGVAAGA